MYQLRGVNLGGWLVIEPWMTPRLFAGTNAIDEWTLSQTINGPDKIRDHHKNFIKEADFKWIKKHGLDAVRLPIGYWALGKSEPYIPNIEQIDFAVKMCEKYDLKLLVCLHGAKGSQNGEMHSGRVGNTGWMKLKNIKFNIDFLATISLRYRNSNCLYGIEIANEPAIKSINPIYLLKIKLFYKRAAKKLRLILKPNQKILISDGYSLSFHNGKLPKNTLLDVHFYQCHSNKGKQLNSTEHISKAKLRSNLIDDIVKHQPLIIGEWSLTLPWNLLKKLDKSSRDELTTRYFESQISSMRKADAIFYWSYKTEGNNLWNYRYLVDSGLIKDKR